MIDTGAPFRLGIVNVDETDDEVEFDFECGCFGGWSKEDEWWYRIYPCDAHADKNGSFNHALAYSEMEKILIDVQTEYGLGGLSSGLYADYASDVARRYAALLLRRVRDRIDKSIDEAVLGATADGLGVIEDALRWVEDAIEETGVKLDD